MNEIVNRVAASGLVTIDLAVFIGNNPISVYDLKDNLFQGLILKEKDFRAFLAEHNWSAYSGHYVCVVCTADAIIPTWAYMLLGYYISNYATKVVSGSRDQLYHHLISSALSQLNLKEYQGKRVVVKGCGDDRIPASAYLDVSVLLKPVVKSLMFGEPCSTVPIYKN